MRVKGLDGRHYTLSLSGNRVLGGDTRKRSGPHLAVRDLLRRVYPLAPILEEVHLPGTNGLTADFVLPHERVVVEVHGEQHFRFSALFHKTRAGFLASLRRDRLKAEWCTLNHFRLIVLRDTEDQLVWQSIIAADSDGQGALAGDDAAGPGGDAHSQGPDPDPQA